MPKYKPGGLEEIWLLVNPAKQAMPKRASHPVKNSIRPNTDLKFVVGRREMDQHLMIAASKHTINTRKNAMTAAEGEDEELFTSTQ